VKEVVFHSFNMLRALQSKLFIQGKGESQSRKDYLYRAKHANQIIPELHTRVQSSVTMQSYYANNVRFI
jgi:hypothetical protein